MGPDNQVAQLGKKTRCRIERAVALFSFLLLTACSKINSVEPFDHKQVIILLQQHYTSQPAQQRIAITLPPHSLWKTVNKTQGLSRSPLMLVPQNENEINWTQAIQTKISGHKNTPHLTPKSFVQEEINALRRACSQIKILSFIETSTYVFYALDKERCKNSTVEKQAAKAFKGKDAVYFVSYSAKKDHVSVKEINKMSRAIETAMLVNNPQYKRTFI